MHCDSCGNQISSGARFCVACGKELPAGVYQGSPQLMGNQQALAPMPPPALAPAGPPLYPAPQAPYGQQVAGGRREFARTYTDGKSPVLALILSLVIVGLGQFYNGDIKKGFLMLGGAIVGGLLSFSLLWWVFSIWSAIDAYRVASRSIPLWT